MSDTRCRGTVWDGWSRRHCTRDATTKAGYCKQHDPVLRQKRDKERQDKWDKKWAVQQEQWKKDREQKEREAKILAAWNSVDELKARIAELEKP